MAGSQWSLANTRNASCFSRRETRPYPPPSCHIAIAASGIDMPRHLLLVDYENVHKIDLSGLDDSYRAIIFVGASQNPPKAARNKATAHRFNRVDFQKIVGAGKNALDFHIAFHLGRTFETAPETTCVVISRDKGYDPLLAHLNASGLICRRVESFAELLRESAPAPIDGAATEPELVVCPRCGKSTTIEHHGGRWCTNCGSFATPPDPALLPSSRPEYRESSYRRAHIAPVGDRSPTANMVCEWCHQPSDMAGAIYDDGEWMCGECIARYAHS